MLILLTLILILYFFFLAFEAKHATLILHYIVWIVQRRTSHTNLHCQLLTIPKPYTLYTTHSPAYISLFCKPLDLHTEPTNTDKQSLLLIWTTMDHDNTFISVTETEKTTVATTEETVTHFTLDQHDSRSSSHFTGRVSSTDTNNSPVRSPPQSRRQKSLVRPERERVDSHHRQYHYRQRATSSDPHTIAPSSTGNQPLRPPEDMEQQVHFTHDTSTISHRQSSSHEKSGAPRMVRRGRSVLGRKTSKQMGASGSSHQMVVEDDDDDDDGEENLPGGAIDLAKPLTFWEKLPDPWLTYCRLLTCCIPSVILSICGKFSG